MRRRFTVIAAALGTAAALVPAVARAHFVLQAPASWDEQDATGLPQKSAPCGQADPAPAAVPTGVVTPYAPGDTVTITINETVPHPGHYRVALSTSGQSGLPAEPQVTAGAMACGSTVVQNPPVFPILADGVLDHTGPFAGPQTFTVTLPTNVTCAKCSLQVIEFMGEHGLNNPGGCFYHHCADISIMPGGGTGTGGSSGSGGAGGSSSGGGGGCAVAGARASVPAGALVLLAVLARRRRRRAPGITIPPGTRTGS
jgi:hypothetical protein